MVLEKLELEKSLFSGKIQIALVWNSRSETSQNSDKLNALANVSFENSNPIKKNHAWEDFYLHLL